MERRKERERERERKGEKKKVKKNNSEKKGKQIREGRKGEEIKRGSSRILGYIFVGSMHAHKEIATSAVQFTSENWHEKACYGRYTGTDR